MDWDEFPITVPGTDVMIRPAREGDAKSIADHFRVLDAIATRQRFGVAGPPAQIDAERIASTVVAVAGHGRVVGEAEHRHDPESARAMEVVGFSVAYETREIGVGRTLVGGLLSLARQRSARHVRSRAIAEDNEAATRTLTRAGFRQSAPARDSGIEFERDLGALVIADLGRAISAELITRRGRDRGCDGISFHLGLTDEGLVAVHSRPRQRARVQGLSQSAIRRQTGVARTPIQELLETARGLVQVVHVYDLATLELALESGLSPEPGRIVLSPSEEIMRRAGESGFDAGLVLTWRKLSLEAATRAAQTRIRDCRPSVVLSDPGSRSRRKLARLGPALLVSEPLRASTLREVLEDADVLAVIARRPRRVVAERDHTAIRSLPR